MVSFVLYGGVGPEGLGRLEVDKAVFPEIP